MKKRGQIANNAFKYLTAIVIVGIILIIGYNYFSGTKSRLDGFQLAVLEKQLKEDIYLVGEEYYGTFRKKTYSIPNNLPLCMFDLSKRDKILSSELIDFYPLVKDSIASNLKDNTFILDEEQFRSSNLGNIEIGRFPYFKCLSPERKKIEFGMQSLGNRTLLIFDFVSTAKLNTNEEVLLESPDGLISIEIHAGTSSNSDSISIEMLEPIPQNQIESISDVYKISPSGITFSDPVKFRIKYNVKEVGTCPNKLTYYQSTEDRSEQIASDSIEIDCKNNIATFAISKFV